ncbi:PREDICTED: protocadherin Fat 4-like [Amphimedon queenslandica]|uniref:Cadherin domain-containing protein n=2 Tax=Amphimedon queenslandica TaxID=400682 RepID=A0AAN0IBY7_AMPQE|nr:PREDICTED: protocadherin Fat 4-like [Amphimedon queenslandica]|eukprot:XP_003384857.1 PREDICTED: protocadherin Fat 4-like [Amphimedon queenslandica]
MPRLSPRLPVLAFLLLILLGAATRIAAQANTVTINQNPPAGHGLINIPCSLDGDKTFDILTVIPAGNVSVGNFTVVGGKLQLAVAAVNIPEGTYTISISCRVGSETEPVAITLIRVERNQYPPVLDHASHLYYTISENSPTGTVVANINVTDNDVGTYGTVTFTINSGSISNAFSINSQTGIVTVGNTLNYVTQNVYNLTIQAANPADVFSPSVVHYVLVNVSVSLTAVPRFNATQYSANVPETGEARTGEVYERPETGFITVQCTDPDTTDITYSLEGANSSVFRINSTTGELMVLSDLDYDNVNTQFYEFSAVCSDGENADTALIQITVSPVNEHAPTATVYAPDTILHGGDTLFYSGPETQFNAGKILLNASDPNFRIVGHDADLGEDGEVTFSLVPSLTNSRGQPFFSINGSTGHMVIINSIDVDSEGLQSAAYSFRIGLSDSSRKITLANVVVFMLVYAAADEDPIFSQASYLRFQSEASYTGVQLLNMTCTDDDIGAGAFSRIAFLPQDEQSQNLSGRFSLNSQTGQLSLSSPLDYETEQVITFTVVCYDTANYNDTAIARISVVPVNDEVPYFPTENYTFPVSRTTPTNFFVIGQVNAMDDDLGYGSNLTYSMESEYFVISPSTGTIFLTGSVQNVDGNEIEHIVTVHDDDATHSATTYITFNITDGNYLAPEFTTNYPLIEISELEPVGSPLVTLFCNDTEEGENGRVSYSIVAGNVASSFTVDSVTGVLSVARSLILPQNTTSASYLLEAQCTDHGVPRLQDSTIVRIQVSYASTVSPDISNDTIIAFIDEDANVNDVVVSITAVYYQDNLNFFFQEESVPNAFLVHSSGTEGSVLVNSILDRETYISYTMTVVAEVITDTSKNDSAELFVYVRDVNDNDPFCTSSSDTLQILETTQKGAVLFDFNCTDSDVGQNANLTYSLYNNYDIFEVNSEGVLYLSDHLNASNLTTFQLILTVSDQGFTPRSITFSTILNVLALNNFAPSFTNLPTTIGLAESTPVFQLPVFTVHAVDNDRGRFGIVRYSLVGQSGLPFILVPNTGELYISNKLDHHDTNQYTLNVSASDGASTTYSTLIVNVTDSNEHSPSCSSTLFARVILEGLEPASVESIPLGCTDEDRGTYGDLSYEITSGNTNNDFSVSSSGSVMTNRALDYELAQSYELIVRVSDGGDRSIDVTVRITVSPKNEHSPVIHNGPFNVTLVENTDIGHTVFVVNGTDEDQGDDGSLEYSLSPQQTAFGITNGGELIVTGVIDREKKSSYSFSIIVRDSGSSVMSASTTASISISDQDDSPPTFTQSLYVESVSSESAEVGDTVASTRCTDPDQGDNADLTYSIISTGSHSSSYFSINTNGDVVISSTLPVSSVYSITVQCSGLLNPNLTDTAVVSLTILIQSNITFDNSTYMSTISEDTQPIYSILTVNASSISGSSLSYSLVYSSTVFQISSSSGVISLISKLDYETQQSYALIVQATDSGTPPNTGQVAVNIFVENVNDMSPVFTNATSSVSINEGQEYSLPVGQFECTDGDFGPFGEVTYNITSGNSNGLFSIDETGGQLLLMGEVDYETTQSLTLQVTCTDGGQASQSTLVSVSIQPVNEVPPVFTSTGVVSLTVAESLIVPTLITVNDELEATDADLAPHNQVWYTISAGNSDSTFAISSTGGDLTLIKELDYETRQSYTLTVQADDSGGASNPTYTVLNSTLTVDIIVTDANDNTPTFSKSVYVGSISESALKGDYVSMDPLNCTDRDSGVNGETTLTIINGNDNYAFQALSNGRISVNNTLDFESESSYILTVRCSDSSQSPRVVDVTVIINIDDVSEFGPVFQMSSYEFFVNETALPGTVVGRAVAVDQDTGSAGEITYTLTNSSDVPFGISTTNGDIFVLVPLDYETGPSVYNLRISAYDFVNQSDSTVVAITVRNIDESAPTFPASNYYGTIRESLSPGTAVSLVNAISCSDPDDEADNIPPSFSLTSSTNEPLPPDYPFNIHQATGILTSLATLNLEATSRYTFRVQCRDSAGNSAFAGVTIDITPFNDFAPVFSNTPYSHTITEGLPLNSLIFTVSATDSDIMSYNAITYGIVAASNPDGRFTIDTTSGAIRNIQDIDYEEQTFYSLNISATNVIPVSDNSGSQSLASYEILSLTINDTNDNSPIITPPAASALITVDDPPGTFVITVSCTDADSGAYGNTTLSLSGSNAGNFELLANGTIITAAEILDTQILLVNCTDMGSPPRSTIAQITVSSTSTNDFPPAFNETLYEFSTPENTTVGDSIGCVTASDGDNPLTPDGMITYTSISIAGADHFRADATTGCIIVVSALDYDDDNQYTYSIRAEDAGVPRRHTLTTVVIYITNIEFDAPEFSSSVYSREMSEGSSVGATVIQNARCTDRDDDDIITYTLEAGNDDGIFSVNSSTGVITLASGLDYETAILHTLTARCTDNTGLYDEVNVTITVTPVNEHTPYVVSALVSINEESPVGTPITIIGYTDLDDGIDGEVTFEIVDSVLHNQLFTISDHTLILNDVLDREYRGRYDLAIRVTDRAQISRSSIDFVNVSLTDINDNAPSPSQSIYTQAINEDTAINATVLTVSCDDDDIGDNAVIDYTISDDNNLFNIDTSGVISVNSNLRFRPRDVLALQAICSDRGQPTLSTSVPVTISVSSINDYPPVFNVSLASVTLPENTSIAVPFIKVNASDNDIGLNGRITFSLIDDFDDQFFINSETGDISLLLPLDYETVSSYALQVLAIDGSDDSLHDNRMNDTMTVNVTVTGINEHTPVCSQPVYSAYINRTSLNEVFRLNCFDSDLGVDGSLSYSIVDAGGYSSLFDITSVGAVTLPAVIAPNASVTVYVLMIAITDGGQPSRSSQIQLNLIYSFDNFYSPMFNQTSYSFNVSESQSVGEVVYSGILATDSDPGVQGEIEYSVNNTDLFRVNPSTGEVFISETIDWESIGDTTTFNVIASDKDPSSPRSSAVPVSVYITDSNDNPPHCDAYYYTVQIGSSLGVGSTVFNVNNVCDDRDGPSHSTLYYEMESSLYSIGYTTGIISVNGTLVAGSSTTLTVTISDNGGLSASALAVSVQVRFDNVLPPVFNEAQYVFNVSEGAGLLESIGTLQATDEDSNSNDLSYALQGADSSLFYIDSTSGGIRLTSLLDYEVRSSYTFSAVVEDSGSYNGSNVLSGTTQVTVNVLNINDNQPMLNNNGLYGTTVNKTTAIGTSILSIECSDADLSPYSSPVYSDTSGFEAIPFNFSSLSNGAGSVIVSEDLRTLSGSVSYTVNITCADAGGRETAGQIYLFVPELGAPIFNSTSYEWEVREDASTNTMFTEISAESQDDTDLTYSITDGNNDGVFYINPLTGVVSLATSLDYEETVSYGLVVKAVDESNRESSTFLLVTVINVNDESPLVSPTAYMTVEQNRPIGYPIGTISCSDSDSIEIMYAFASTYTAGTFNISDNGIVHVSGALDDTPVHVIPVLCYDVAEPDDTSKGILTIETVFVNLYNPTFEFSSYQTSLPENTPLQSPVTTVRATDDDIGTNGEITYSIVGGNPNKFYIDSQSGVISVLTSLDRESVDSYSITIQATDGGISGNATNSNSANTTLNVTVLDINDNAPRLSQLAYVQFIYTNHSLLSTVLQVECSDGDLSENGTISYSIDPAHDSFSINSEGSVLLTSEQMEQTVHSFNVLCTDMSTAPLSSSALVTIVVSKDQFEAPTFTNNSYSVSIPEDQGMLEPFLTVSATSNESGVSIVYSISNGNEGTAFFIDPSSGNISVISTLDYLQNNLYTLTIRASTSGFVQYSSYATVTVSITDVNNNQPYFIPTPFYIGSVNEAGGSLEPVVRVNCSDTDPSSILSYSLISSTPSNGVNYFNITSEGQVITTGPLDYESVTVYTLTVHCSDGGSTPAEAIVQVSVLPVNEFKPVFEMSSYSFSISESESVGSTIGNVSATDADGGTDGQISYILVDPDNSSAIFVDPSTGSLIVSSTLDYETTSFYNLSIIGRDYAGSETYVPVEITITNVQDVDPVLLPSVSVYSGRVVTNSPPGLFIESYTCTDQDGGSTSISIESGNGLGYFRLNQFNHIVWNDSISLTSDQVVSLSIECTDESNARDTASFAAVVGPPGKAPPQFSMSVYTESILENATSGTEVLSVSATPANPNNTVQYSVVGITLASFPFQLDPVSGVLSVNATLNYEDIQLYSFPIQARDVNDSTVALAIIEVTINNINDNPPLLLPESLSLTLPENSPTSTSIGKFSCTDEDDEDSITYYIETENPTSIFSISSSGYLSLQSSLDYETVQSHNITVVCSDQGSPSLTDSSIVLITVSPINEHRPMFDSSTYNFSVSEKAPLSQVIGFVSASDEDDGNNGEFYYTNYGGSGDSYFLVGFDSGNISVTNFLNASESDELTLAVAAIDYGPPSPLLSVATVVLSIEDINESPYFGAISYIVSTRTDITGAGDTLTTVQCFDYDVGSNARVSLSIASVTSGISVSLSNTGSGDGSVSSSLVTVASLIPGSHEIIVQCSDSGVPQLARNVSVVLVVQGANGGPVFDSAVYGLSINEDIEINSQLLNITATDPEGDDIVYTLTGGTGLGTFGIDPSTGILRLLLKLDYETTSFYLLTVTASDTDSLNPMSANVTVSIVIANVNDHPPVLSPSTYTTTQMEGNHTSLSIQSYTCTDADGGTTSLSVSPAPPFAINSNGDVTFSGIIDYEEATVLSATVTCTDSSVAGADSPLSTTGTISISVIPVNFHDPVITSPLAFNVSEGSSVGDVIATITAYDPDMRGSITYQTSSHSSLATLNANTGQLALASTLDRETTSEYDFEITVSDNDNIQGLTPKTTSATITLIVTDINDHSPSCDVTLQTVTILANTYNQSLSLFNASCTDSDIGVNAVLRYTVDQSTLPTEGTFYLNETTGSFSMNGTISKSSTGSIVAISVSDLGTNPVSNPVLIQLIFNVFTGNEPRFEPNYFNVTIAENYPSTIPVLNGSVLMSSLLNIEDSSVSFRFITNTTDFIIDSSTGDVFLLATSQLDYDEGETRYSLGIQASVNTDVTEAILEVFLSDYNDNPPVFSSQLYNGSVKENLSPGQTVLTVSATDIDSADNAIVRYSILYGSTDFSIDQISGVIKTLKQFDREVIPSYSLFVKAADLGQPPLSSTVTVTIYIGDENDSPPSFQNSLYNLLISDLAQPGDIITTFSVTDPDITGSINYAIVAADAALLEFIQLNPFTGELSLKAPIPSDHLLLYEFKVTANDQIHTVETDVVLQVATLSQTSISLEENVLDQTYNVFSFLQLSANLSSNTVYDIIDGDPLEQFDISETGILSNIEFLDRENISHYQLLISAIDNTTNENSILALSIDVADKNDNAPMFNSSSYSITIQEGHYSVPTVIGLVYASDADQPNTENSRITYKLLAIQPPLSDTTEMILHEVTGELKVRGTLDRETSETYEMVIQAEDHGEPQPLIAYTSLKMTLTDVNDNVPRFATPDVASFIVYYAAGVPIGTEPENILSIRPIVQLDPVSSDSFRFSDADSSDVATASLEGAVNMSLVSNSSPARLASTGDISTMLNGSVFHIIITDGLYVVNKSVTVMIIQPTPTSSVYTSTAIESTMVISTTATSVSLSVTPSSSNVDFISSPLGIATIIVGTVFFFAIILAIFCICCFCYQYFQKKKDNEKRRTTSVFKRVEVEGRPARKIEEADLHKNPSYQYHEFDQLDYPHYVPHDPSLGQMYGEYNEVETDFGQSMNGSLPPMYPYPMPYPGYPMQSYPQSYGGFTPGTSMSEVKPFSSEESGEEDTSNEDRMKYRMGPILGSVVEDFRRGDEVLQKDDVRKSKSSLLNLTGKSRSKK